MKNKKNIGRIGISIIFIFSGMLFSGCYSIVEKTYPGPELPQNQIAVMTSPFAIDGGRATVQFLSCDGVTFTDVPDRLTLLPGTHSIEFTLLRPYNVNPITQSVSVEAGKTYSAVGIIGNGSWQVDISQNK